MKRNDSKMSLFTIHKFVVLHVTNVFNGYENNGKNKNGAKAVKLADLFAAFGFEVAVLPQLVIDIIGVEAERSGSVIEHDVQI